MTALDHIAARSAALTERADFLAAMVETGESSGALGELTQLEDEAAWLRDLAAELVAGLRAEVEARGRR